MTLRTLIAASLLALNSVLLVSCKAVVAQNSEKIPTLKITSITAPKDYVKGEPESISKDGSVITGAYWSKELEKHKGQPEWYRFNWSTAHGFVRIAGRGFKRGKSSQPDGWKPPVTKGVKGLAEDAYCVRVSEDGFVALFMGNEHDSFLWVKGKGWLALNDAVKSIPEYAKADWRLDGPGLLSADGKRVVVKYASFKGAEKSDLKGRHASGIAIVYAPNGWEGFTGFVNAEE